MAGFGRASRSKAGGPGSADPSVGRRVLRSEGDLARGATGSRKAKRITTPPHRGGGISIRGIATPLDQNGARPSWWSPGARMKLARVLATLATPISAAQMTALRAWKTLEQATLPAKVPAPSCRRLALAAPVTMMTKIRKRWHPGFLGERRNHAPQTAARGPVRRSA